MRSAIECLSQSYGHAQFDHNAFSSIVEKRKDWYASKQSSVDIYTNVTRLHYENEIEVEAMFIQTWGSTALGFGGIGGSAMTDAYTIILRSTYHHEYLVYFNGTFAYKVSKPNGKFVEDIKNKYLTDVSTKSKYI